MSAQLNRACVSIGSLSLTYDLVFLSIVVSADQIQPDIMNQIQPTTPLIWLGKKRGILYFEDLAAAQRAPLYLVNLRFYNKLQLYSVSGEIWQAKLSKKPKVPFWAGLFDGKRLVDIELSFERIGNTDLIQFKKSLVDQYRKYPKDFTLRFDDGDQILAGINQAPSMQDLFTFIRQTIDARG